MPETWEELLVRWSREWAELRDEMQARERALTERQMGERGQWLTDHPERRAEACRLRRAGDRVPPKLGPLAG